MSKPIIRGTKVVNTKTGESGRCNYPARFTNQYKSGEPVIYVTTEKGNKETWPLSETKRKD